MERETSVFLYTISFPTCLPSALTRLKFYLAITMGKLGGNDQIPHSMPFIKMTILFTKIFTYNSITLHVL